MPLRLPAWLAAAVTTFGGGLHLATAATDVVADVDVHRRWVWAVRYEPSVNKPRQPIQLAVYPAPSPPVKTADDDSGKSALPLKKQSAERSRKLILPDDASNEPAEKSSPGPSLVTAASALAIVLGLFFLVVWLLRRGMPRGSRPLAKEVVEVLGRLPLHGKQQIQLLRFGRKLVLVSVSAGGTDAIAEITDPIEVDRLSGICQQSHALSATAAFRQVFQQYSGSQVSPSLLDRPRDDFAEFDGDDSLDLNVPLREKV